MLSMIEFVLPGMMRVSHWASISAEGISFLRILKFFHSSLLKIVPSRILKTFIFGYRGWSFIWLLDTFIYPIFLFLKSLFTFHKSFTDGFSLKISDSKCSSYFFSRSSYSSLTRKSKYKVSPYLMASLFRISSRNVITHGSKSGCLERYSDGKLSSTFL